MQSITSEFAKIMDEAKCFVRKFPWSDKNAYALWLSQTYFFVRHSSRLLALGAASSTLAEDSLHRRMVSHLREEMGHDKIARNDLQNLGYDINALREFAPTKAFYQNQYYYLQNRMAPSFLGYILFLEGLAASEGPYIYKIVRETFGSNCANFVKTHSEEDQQHIVDALKQVESLEASEASEVVENMRLSCELYRLMMEEAIFDTHQKTSENTNYRERASNLSIFEPASM